MINNQTTEATEAINNFSDTQMQGTGIGQSSPEINLNQISGTNKQQTTKKPDQEETTQGQHEMNIRDAYEKIENITEARDILNKGNMHNILSNSYMQKLIKQMEKDGVSFKGLNQEEMITEFHKELNKEEETARNLIYDTKNKEDTTYDNRTDEQVREDKLQDKKEDREDNAYERAVQDMMNAGLNPAGVMGGAMSSGGGGGGGSNSQKEEEERKRKKREEEERRRAEAAQKQRELMQMLGMISGIGGMLSLGSMQSAGRQKQEHIRGQNQLDTERLRGSNRIDQELIRLERTREYNQARKNKKR